MNDLYKAASNMLDRYISLAESGEINWKSNQEKEEIALLKALMDQPCKTGAQCIGGKCSNCEWVGLTDEELPEGATYEFDRGVRWAETKLKEKNT